MERRCKCGAEIARRKWGECHNCHRETVKKSGKKPPRQLRKELAEKRKRLTNKTPCRICEAHHEILRGDPERLSTEFIMTQVKKTRREE